MGFQRNAPFRLRGSRQSATLLRMKILGIDLGGTKTALCVGNETGEIALSRRYPTQAPEGPEAWFQRTLPLLESLLRDAGQTWAQIDAVGVSCPGPMSVKRGILLEPPNMRGWVDVPVHRWFSEALKKPVFINNDANACGLAEWMFGSCKGARDLVYLTMSTGLGAGVIVNGQVAQGAADLAGEVGHHCLDINGPPCPCGRRGCLEIYCGGMNVANRLRERIVREQIRTAILDNAGGDPARIDFKAFADAARAGDPFAREYWAEYIERLAQGVGNVIMMFNPEAILMGTIAIHTGDFLLHPLLQALPRYTWLASRESCRIMPSALGARIGDLSALAIAIAGLRTP